MIIVRCLSIIKIWHSSLFLLCWKQELNSLTQQGLTICTMLFIYLSMVSADCRLVCANSQSNRTQERRKCASLRSPTDCSDMANRPVFKGYGWIQLDILCYAAYHEQRQYQYVVNKISDLLASPLHFIYITCDMSGGQGLATFSTLPSCWRPDLEIVAKSGYHV